MTPRLESPIDWAFEIVVAGRVKWVKIFHWVFNEVRLGQVDLVPAHLKAVNLTVRACDPGHWAPDRFRVVTWREGFVLTREHHVP